MKDTNPDHYKVNGANFIKYMDDPQIKGFGDWMFANGYNVAEMDYTMKEQGCAKIKEPDCRICGQSHCKYYHESRKPTECKSYVRMEGR